MNIEIRIKVLQSSLILEGRLNEILIFLLNINKENINTLGHKSSALSFKSKADLLYDIEIISKDLYKELILFMQIRNQFIHNLDAESFKIVLNRIEGNRNKLLRYIRDQAPDFEELSEQQQEKLFSQAFLILTHHLDKNISEKHMELIKKRMEQNEKEFERKKNKALLEFSNDAFQIMEETIDETVELMDKAYNQALMESGIDYDTKVIRVIKPLYKKLFEKKLQEKYPEFEP